MLLDSTRGGIVRNRFNLLTSKEWLPFQKSWFLYSADSDLLRSNIRFFTKSDVGHSKVYLSGLSSSKNKDIIESEGLNQVGITEKNISFAYIDIRKDLEKISTVEEYSEFITDFVKKLEKIFDRLEERRFICVIAKNYSIKGNYIPYAWDIGKIVGSIFSLKDEKIACLDANKDKNSPGSRRQGGDFFYCLYFRRDELSPRALGQDVAKSSLNWDNYLEDTPKTPAWFILKPPPRRKDEILHPAKYPEELVDLFVQTFTEKDANVYDPMSGTGSTQVGAMRNSRNGYGMELSNFFAEIANSRCDEITNPSQESLFDSRVESISKVINDDSRNYKKYSFPKMHYLLTSPPYWDMLNMKGAENQAKRLEKGLKTNYSEDLNDLGNISDYYLFIETLANLYFDHVDIFVKGAYMTIVVKNIKKKGSNYPFAWDIAFLMQEKFVLLPENFWLQDDISIAPFGYGYTWVSNTFHQYCLHFKLRSR